MTAAELLLDLDQRGIRLEAHGDRLRYSPRSALTPDLLARLNAYKPDVLVLLRATPEPAVRVMPCVDDPAIRCPWCRGMRLEDDDQRGGLACVACSRLAFRDTPSGGLVRCDHEGQDWIDPSELKSCPKCRTLELWQTLAGNWRCLHCDPPTTSRRLAELAARIRRRSK